MAANADPPGADCDYLLSAVKKLRSTSDYSDLTIKCGTRQWPVHKAIVCTQSSFFANACKAGWRESTSGVINLEDEREEVVTAMIEFFYLSTFDYARSIATGASVLGPLQFSVKVFTTADKFDINGLDELALRSFNLLVEQASTMPPSDFISTISEVYEQAPSRASSMRHQLVSKTISQAAHLFNRPSEELHSSPQFQKLIMDIPSFGAEVVLALTARMEEKMTALVLLRKEFSGSETTHCDHCNLDFKVAKGFEGSIYYCPRCKKSAIRFWAWE